MACLMLLEERARRGCRRLGHTGHRHDAVLDVDVRRAQANNHRARANGLLHGLLARRLCGEGHPLHHDAHDGRRRAAIAVDVSTSCSSPT